MKSDDLYSKPYDYKFSDEEVKIVAKENPKYKFKFFYAIWKQHRRNNRYIIAVYDQEPSAVRRSPFFNSIEILEYRELTDIEHREICSNWGTWNRRFKVWNYENIEELVADDKQYDIVTPQKVVEACMNKQYTTSVELKKL